MLIAPKTRTVDRWARLRQEHRATETSKDDLYDATQDEEELDGLEEYWRDRYAFFRRKGFILRPPNATQQGMSGNVSLGETSPLSTHRYGHVVYATRASDGRQVCIKRVVTGSSELRIVRMLSSLQVLLESSHGYTNHAVPVLTIFEDEENVYITYIVMPLLQHIDSASFQVVGDAVDFIDQLLEGLAFFHECGVAHRDCSCTNLMMSTRNERLLRYSDLMGTPKSASNRSARSRRTYYFIDFGLSVYVKDRKCTVRVLGNEGHDRDPPELHQGNRIPYDPYKLDVYLIGNVFRRILLDRYPDLQFLAPLADLMTRTDPAERPAANEALKLWRNTRSGFGEAFLQQCLHTHANRLRGSILKLSLVVCLVLLGVRIQKSGMVGTADLMSER